MQGGGRWVDNDLPSERCGEEVLVLVSVYMIDCLGAREEDF